MGRVNESYSNLIRSSAEHWMALDAGAEEWILPTMAGLAQTLEAGSLRKSERVISRAPTAGEGRGPCLGMSTSSVRRGMIELLFGMERGHPRTGNDE